MASNNAINTPFPINVASGGTGAATFTAHGVLLGEGTSAFGVAATSATSGVPLISQGSSSDPAFGTAVVAGGGTGATTFTAYAVITAGTTATGVFQNVSGVGSSGQVLTSAGAAALPTWSTPGAAALAWSVITANQNAVKGNAYICNKAGTLVLTLPSTAVVGDTILVTGMNTATGWQIAQNSGQTINFGTSTTTSGAGGSLTSTNIYDTITVTCNVTNTGWIAYNAQGNITVV